MKLLKTFICALCKKEKDSSHFLRKMTISFNNSMVKKVSTPNYSVYCDSCRSLKDFQCACCGQVFNTDRFHLKPILYSDDRFYCQFCLDRKFN